MNIANRTALFLLTFSILLASCTSTSVIQCPAPVLKSYAEVMNEAFLEDYEKCPVRVECEFYLPSGWKNYFYGNGVKKNIALFQCVLPGESSTKAPISGEKVGDLFGIDKASADILFQLKPGDHIMCVGRHNIYRFAGKPMFHYFEVTEMVKVQ